MNDIRIIVSLCTLAVSVVTIFVKFAYDYSRITGIVHRMDIQISENKSKVEELYGSRIRLNSDIAKLIESDNAVKDRLNKLEQKIDLLIEKFYTQK